MSINAIADFPGEKLLPVLSAKVMGCVAVATMILGGIVLAGHLLPYSSLTLFPMKTALLVTAAGTVSLALCMLAQRRAFLKVVSVIALFAIAFYIVFPDTSWARYIEAGAIISGVVIFTSFALLLQRRASTRAIMKELETCERIELEEPYLHASLHHWLAKEGARRPDERGISKGEWKTFLLGIQGKEVYYTKTGFTTRLNCDPPSKEPIEIVENSSQGIEDAYQESFGCAYNPKDACVCFTRAGRVLGGAFYKVVDKGIFIHDVCRLANVVGVEIVKKTIEFVQAKDPTKKLLVYVVEGNPARKVYEKYGFKVSKLSDTGRFSFFEMERPAPQVLP